MVVAAQFVDYGILNVVLLVHKTYEKDTETTFYILSLLSNIAGNRPEDAKALVEHEIAQLLISCANHTNSHTVTFDIY